MKTKHHFTFIAFFLIAGFCQAQYFQNSVYYRWWSPFEATSYSHDSLKLISMDSTEELYEYISYRELHRSSKRIITLRYRDGKLSFKLNSNKDNTYKLLFDNNVIEGEYIYLYAFPELLEFTDYTADSTDIIFDSTLSKVIRIEQVKYNLQTRKTYNLSRNSFVDSIGFLDFGLHRNKYGYGWIYYICSTDSTNTLVESFIDASQVAYCNSDTFYKHYNGSSINNIQAFHALYILPNPSEGNITIRSPLLKQNLKGQIYSYDGKTLNTFVECQEDGEINLDLSAEKPGFYYILFENGLRGQFLLE